MGEHFSPGPLIVIDPVCKTRHSCCCCGAFTVVHRFSFSVSNTVLHVGTFTVLHACSCTVWHCCSCTVPHCCFYLVVRFCKACPSVGFFTNSLVTEVHSLARAAPRGWCIQSRIGLRISQLCCLCRIGVMSTTCITGFISEACSFITPLSCCHKSMLRI